MPDVIAASPHAAVKTAIVALFTTGLSATGMSSGGSLLPSGKWALAPLPGATVGADESFTKYPSECLVIDTGGEPTESRAGIGLYDIPLEIEFITPRDMAEDEREQRIANVQSFLSAKLHTDEPEPQDLSVFAFRVNKVLEAQSLPAVVWDLSPDSAIRMESAKDEEGRDSRVWKLSLRASAKPTISA